MPNSSVDECSRELLACYPRRTFCPLIDGPSTWNHRVTMADFRLCLTCGSSQSSKHVPLRFNKRFQTGLSLPSHASVTVWEATAPVKLATLRCFGRGLTRSNEVAPVGASGVPLRAPLRPERKVRRLPLTLCAPMGAANARLQ